MLGLSDGVYKLNQGRTGHSSNAMLVVGAFTLTKCLKRGLSKELPFEFFCMECRRPFDPSPPLSLTQNN
jgi:hypothetical protein